MDTRTRILDAAARLFHVHGYANTTVRILGEEVGLESGSIFHHFDTKQAVLVEIINRDIARLRDHVRRAVAEVSDAEARLPRFLRTHLDVVLDDIPHIIPLVLREWPHLPTGIQQAALATLREHVGDLADILRDLNSQTDIGPAVIRAQLLIGAANDGCWLPHDQRPDKNMVERMLVTFAEG